MGYNTLTENEFRIIEQKGTEQPFAGEYDDFYLEGTFICRRCNAPLYSSKDKFDAGCGWPAFDKNFEDAILRKSDKDGYRIEILCSHCKGHLGHEFRGEQFTKSNVRACVNSLSIKFIPHNKPLPPLLEN